MGVGASRVKDKIPCLHAPSPGGEQGPEKGTALVAEAGGEGGGEEGGGDAAGAEGGAAGARPSGEEELELVFGLELCDLQLATPKPPAPTLRSALCHTYIGDLLTLSWQLMITRSEETALIHLLHKTPGIPDPPYTFKAYLKRHDGNLVELTLNLLLHLARSQPNPKSALLKHLVYNGKDLHLHIFIRINLRALHPLCILEKSIDKAEKGRINRSGEMGKRLWMQTLEAAETEGEGNDAPDVRFVCSKGETVYAHRLVLIAFSSHLKEYYGYLEAGTLFQEQTSSQSADAVREVLYFLYNHRASRNLSKSDLSGVLDTMALLKLDETELLRLEVERLLLRLLDQYTIPGLAHLTTNHNLPVLDNVIRTLSRPDSPALNACLRSLADPTPRSV